ncbi:hypothetical protein D3C76_1812730 [compost metagenome]
MVRADQSQVSRAAIKLRAGLAEHILDEVQREAGTADAKEFALRQNRGVERGEH